MVGVAKPLAQPPREREVVHRVTWCVEGRGRCGSSYRSSCNGKRALTVNGRKCAEEVLDVVCTSDDDVGGGVARVVSE